MRLLLLTTVLLTMLRAQAGEPSFRDQQLTYPRVQAAYAANWRQLKTFCRAVTSTQAGWKYSFGRSRSADD